jgi:hypothetical protein
MLAKKNPEVKEAAAVYMKLSWSERRKMIAEAREKRRRDDYAIAQTIAEGLAQDMAQDIAKDIAKDMAETMAETQVRQKQLEIARKMKMRGILSAQIAEDTGLSIEEITGLH